MAEERAENELEQLVMTSEVSLKLRQSREAKGLSLHEAETATRIPVHYLRLLEGKGDARVLSDALYLVPFLRTYAGFLGLDPAEAIAQFVQSVHGKEDTVSDLSQAPIPPRAAVPSTILVVVFISIVCLALFWLLGRQ